MGAAADCCQHFPGLFLGVGFVQYLTVKNPKGIGGNNQGIFVPASNGFSFFKSPRSEPDIVHHYPAHGKTIGESWLAALADWAKIMVGLVVPLFLGAAFLEVFVTPRVAIWLLGG
jgi:hypothetical protein